MFLICFCKTNVYNDLYLIKKCAKKDFSGKFLVIQKGSTTVTLYRTTFLKKNLFRIKNTVRLTYVLTASVLTEQSKTAI